MGASASADVRDVPPAAVSPIPPSLTSSSSFRKRQTLTGSDIEYRFPSGSVYVGSFHNGHLHGKGVYRYQDTGDVYEGDFASDVRHGQGTYRYRSGDVFVGAWVSGLKEGPGTYTFSLGGAIFTGMWKDDCIFGHGTLRLPHTGETFEGEWVEQQETGELILQSGAIQNILSPRAAALAGANREDNDGRVIEYTMVEEFPHETEEPFQSVTVITDAPRVFQLYSAHFAVDELH